MQSGATRCADAPQHPPTAARRRRHPKRRRRPGAAVLLPPLVLVGLLGIVLLASGSSGTKQFASLLGVQGVADRLAALDAAGRGGGGPAALPQTAASQLLSRCTTFACLRKVHSMAPASAARFSFPHFMCACDGGGCWRRAAWATLCDQTASTHTSRLRPTLGADYMPAPTPLP